MSVDKYIFSSLPSRTPDGSIYLHTHKF